MDNKKQILLENIQKCLLLSLLALCANLFFSIPIFGTTTLIFGSIFVYLSIQLIPPTFSIIVLCSSLVGMLQSGQYWQEIVVHIAEYAVIAFLLYRQLFLVFASALFWVILGTPILWGLFHLGTSVNEQALMTLSIHNGLNGILNAGIASSILIFIPRSIQNIDVTGKQSKLATNIFALCSTTMVVPLLIICFIFTANSARESEISAKDNLKAKANFVSQASQSFIEQHMQIVAQQANLLSINSPDYLVQESMLLAQTQYPSFFNLTITDAEGNFVFFAPESYNEEVIAQVPEDKRHVRDRDYFIQAKRTERIYVSNATLSRGITEEPMLAISVPYFSNSIFEGIVFGAINLNLISEVNSQIRNLLLENQVIITDAKGSIILSNYADILSPLQTFIPMASISVSSGSLSVTNIENRDLFFERSTNSFGWRVYALAPTDALIRKLEDTYLRVGVTVLLVLSVFLIFAYRLSSEITRPLKSLLSPTTELEDDSPIISNSREFYAVQQKLKQSQSLVQNFENRLKQQVNEKTVQLEQLNMQLAAQAREDGLTQLLNRKGFEDLANNAIKTNIRLDQPFSLAILDIDHFKDINDSYGHPFGDKCLRAFAALLHRNCKRETDILGRYGGEEFIIMMSGNVVETHHKILHNIHQQTMGMQHKVPNTKDIVSFSVSIGVCSVLGNVNMSLQEVVKLADEELYKCKRNGRNKVSIVSFGYAN